MIGPDQSTNQSAIDLTIPVVGREEELRRLRQFLEDEEGPACLVFSGVPGIGKTTLWEAGIEFARERGYEVLATRTSEPEATLSFTALVDLVERIDDSDLASLPAPQRHAIEVTLHRAHADTAPSDPLALSAGFLNLLRTLTGRGPLLIAIDDLQWLDPASQIPILFAARRLSGGPARFLLTRRPGRRSGLERALSRAGVQEVEISPMSIGAIGRVLSDRLGLRLSRRVMRNVHEGSHGNPLFALELGRLVAENRAPAIRGELPIPELADDIFGPRILQADAGERRILLAVTLSPDLSKDELFRLADPLQVENAVTSGLVVVERSRVRPAHPMLAAAARKHAGPSERKVLHQELASAVSDPILRAHHLATAAGAPDADLASATAAAADLSARQGRLWEAAQLGEHALRLTPPGDELHAERVLVLARFFLAAGEFVQMADLLSANLGDLPPGRHRALAHLLLCMSATGDVDAHEVHLELALADAGDDPEVQATAFSRRAIKMAVGSVERIDEAELWATRATSVARSADARTEELAMAALAWTSVLGGRPIGALPVSPASAEPLSVYEASIDRPLGVQLAFRGQVEKARVVFNRLLLVAEERGELRSMAAILLQQCEVELRAGHVDEAARLLHDVEELLATQEERPSTIPRVRALLAAEAGDPVEAALWAGRVLRRDPHGSNPPNGWDRLEAARAMGLAALFDNDPVTARQYLLGIWDHAEKEHIDDPGAFPVAGDLVETLVQLGRFDQATEVIERLRRLSDEQEHPWGLATLARAVSLVQLAAADEFHEGAAEALGAAAAAYGDLGLDFDRARTLLSLGVIQRRFKKRSSARESLEQAAGLFEDCGSPGWAGRSRSELDRVSGRRSAPSDRLTPSERKAASLAANGFSNKEIARQLFVSVNTVEGHLSRAYAKLGVRSRGELVRLLGGSDLQ